MQKRQPARFAGKPCHPVLPVAPTLPKKPDVKTPRLALSKCEAAEALGISVSSLDKLIASGDIKISQAGRRCLIAVKALHDFLDRSN